MSDDQRSAASDERSLEQLIRAAGDFLVVSDDLRPRVMESVRQVGRDRSANTHLAAVLALVLGLSVLVSTWVLSWTASSPAREAAPRGSGARGELGLRRAAKVHTAGSASEALNWGLVEAYRRHGWSESSTVRD